MTEWVRDAALATQLRIWECTNDRVPDDNSPCGLRHVEDMLEAIVQGEIKGDKAHRWLGWAQAVVYMGGGATLDELKAINKKAMGE